MTTYLHYSMIDEDDFWFPACDAVRSGVPSWRPGCAYDEYAMVECGGIAFISKAAANLQCPADASQTGWDRLNLVALPWRRSVSYADGALIYSTKSGAIWIYDEPSEEWCLLLTMSHKRRAEVRARRMRQVERHA